MPVNVSSPGSFGMLGRLSGPTAATTTRAGQAVSADPVVRQKLAATFIDLEVMRLTGLRGLSRLAKGEALGQESSFTKLYWSHMYQRLLETALEVAGADAALAPGFCDRIVQRPRVIEGSHIETHDVGRRARRQSADIVAIENGGAPARCKPQSADHA